jgi:hypothetical protein
LMQEKKNSTVWNSDLFYHSVSNNATDMHHNVNNMTVSTSNKVYRFSYHSVNQQMHAVCQNHNNVVTRPLLHISGLTGPSSGSAQLHKTIA